MPPGPAYRPSWAPAGIDLARPSPARVYDYYLGGSHNFAVDRDMAREAMKLWPDIPAIMQANRAFLRRTVNYLTNQGVGQFIDIGSGIPTVGSVHEVAQRQRPDARVVYVDMDPVAVAHSRAILAGVANTGVVEADVRQPDRIFMDPRVRELVDPAEPIAVLLVAVLHFISDEEDPPAIVASVEEYLPSGSYLVISHASHEGQHQQQAESHQDLYRRNATPMTMRSHREITDLFCDLELVPPGVVHLPLWHPESPADVDERPERIAGLGGIGHKR